MVSSASAFDEPVGAIRDSLYDRLPLTRRDMALMATTAMLRLDEVKQLGFIGKVWPGAKHTRFEHSLGVGHLTRLALRQLQASLAETGQPPLSASDIRTAVAAALLHDVGHYPFSHCIEELGPPVDRHEVVSRRIITSGPVAEVLATDWGIAPARVGELVAPSAPLNGVDALLGQLLSGALDMDKVDYLPRDAKSCNVPYGRVDTQRLIESLRVHLVDGAPRLVISEKGVSPVHSLINARQEMFDNVYWHHTGRACNAMLMRAVQEALHAGTITASGLTGLTDAGLLARLADDRMPGATRDLVERLNLRRIHKRGLEISARAGAVFTRLNQLFGQPVARARLEQRLAEALAGWTGRPVAAHDVLLDVPKPERWSTEVWIWYDRPPLGFDTLMHWTDAVGLGPATLQTYEDHQRRIRLFVAEGLVPAVQANLAGVIQILGGPWADAP